MANGYVKRQSCFKEKGKCVWQGKGQTQENREVKYGTPVVASIGFGLSGSQGTAWVVKPHCQWTVTQRCHCDSHGARVKLDGVPLQPHLVRNADPLQHTSFLRGFYLHLIWDPVTEHWVKGYSQLRNSFLRISQGVCVRSKTYTNATESCSPTAIWPNCSRFSGMEGTFFPSNEQKSVWKSCLFMVARPSTGEVCV